MTLENKNILIISNEPWGDIWFSKHNYANELSKKNLVFFIDPAGRWSLYSLFRSRVNVREVQKNLFVVSYYNFLPHYFLRINNRIVSWRIRKKLEKSGIKKTFFWSFDPVRLFQPGLLNAEFSIFEAVDKYRLSFKGEKVLYKNADAFIVISEEFREFYAKYNKPVLTVPHAIPSDEFVADHFTDVKPVTDSASALYVGNIDYRLNYRLIVKMVKKFPQIKFVFIGGMRITEDQDFIDLFIGKKYPNVYYTGKKHFKELKVHIASCGFCIAPMRIFEGNTISHHKIFQYLAMGKAVFSCEFSEYKKFSGLLYMENDEEMLLKKINDFLEKKESPGIALQRIELAKQFTFEVVLGKIENFLSKIYTH